MIGYKITNDVETARHPIKNVSWHPIKNVSRTEHQDDWL